MGSADAAEDGPKPRTQPHLMPQDASTVDPSKLNALTPEVVSQSTITLFSQSPCVQLLRKASLTHTFNSFHVRFPAKPPSILERLDTSRTASPQSSRPSPECRLCVSRTSWSETSPLSWAMPTPRSTRATSSPRREASTPLEDRRTQTSLKTEASRTDSGVTCPLSTAPATTFSWPPCSTALLSWTLRYFWWPATNHVRNRKRRNTWRRWRL